MVYSAKDDLDSYLASTDKPDPGIVRALVGAVERSAPKPAADPGFTPATVSSAPEVTTAEFLSQQNQQEWARRNKIEVDAVTNAPAFDADAHDERRKREFARFQIGNLGGSTSITGEKP